jgi:hypothetical protein
MLLEVSEYLDLEQRHTRYSRKVCTNGETGQNGAVLRGGVIKISYAKSVFQRINRIRMKRGCDVFITPP